MRHERPVNLLDPDHDEKTDAVPRCEHPDPTTLPFCWCRRCGYFVEGERVSDANHENLRAMLSGCVGLAVDVITGSRSVAPESPAEP